jgi:acetyltransferase-like isoleucine patch superfamily enzyme
MALFSGVNNLKEGIGVSVAVEVEFEVEVGVLVGDEVLVEEGVRVDAGVGLIRPIHAVKKAPMPGNISFKKSRRDKVFLFI